MEERFTADPLVLATPGRPEQWGHTGHLERTGLLGRTARPLIMLAPARPIFRSSTP